MKRDPLYYFAVPPSFVGQWLAPFRHHHVWSVCVYPCHSRPCFAPQQLDDTGSGRRRRGRRRRRRKRSSQVAGWLLPPQNGSSVIKCLAPCSSFNAAPIRDGPPQISPVTALLCRKNGSPLRAGHGKFISDTTTTTNVCAWL